MTAGRPRKPTALRELQGGRTRPHHNPNEPTPDVRIPDRPMWLDDDPTASALYDEVCRYVVDMKVGTSVDGIALGLLADQLAIYIKFRSEVMDYGVMIEVFDAKGNPQSKINPAMKGMNEATTNIHKLLREYGLTAASRSSVGAEIEKEVSSFDDFMSL
jgi:phage terminase small subunit